MNNNPETPSEGTEPARAEVPKVEGTPTTDMSGSYSPPSAQTGAASWQPGQYSSGSTGETPSVPPVPPAPPAPPAPPLPPYPETPAQPAPAPPQYGYQYPPQQGQPTQYVPPQQYSPPSYPQSNPPTVPMQSQPPSYQQGNYGPGYPQSPQQPTAYGYAPPKDPTVGLLLELIGYVGFLGIGHIWAGKTVRGIALMIGFWVYLTISGILTIVLIGCFMLAAAAVVPIASGLYLKNEMEREQAAMGIRR